MLPGLASTTCRRTARYTSVQSTRELMNTPPTMPHRQTAFVKSQSEQGRPSSAPLPASHSQITPDLPRSVPLPVQKRNLSEPRTSNAKDNASVTSLDLMSSLQRSGPSVVKTRTGSVLTRGFILKTDHYPSGTYIFISYIAVRSVYLQTAIGRALDLDLNVHGAPNFRAPRQGDLNVFGCAQPRTQGLRAILSVLRCSPNTPDPSHVVWFSTREEPIGTCTIYPTLQSSKKYALTAKGLNDHTNSGSTSLKQSTALLFHML